MYKSVDNSNESDSQLRPKIIRLLMITGYMYRRRIIT
ncbi:hypothetical protein AAS21_gp188 [Pantoea phage vB_PagS_AAS21]|uniref:Uncharacterized protein n=1 Tax=Pantoea phage vB_PagS_AAS21 TaxID=2575261 RepID=A0A4Y5P1T8_9CAUD|nr:hypothetical protein AAS21_gp188 [Pantoea phage vB_PagS_AAS21]